VAKLDLRDARDGLPEQRQRQAKIAICRRQTTLCICLSSRLNAAADCLMSTLREQKRCRPCHEGDNWGRAFAQRAGKSAEGDAHRHRADIARGWNQSK